MITVTENPKHYSVAYEGLTPEQFDASEQWCGDNGVSYESYYWGDGRTDYIALIQATPEQRATYERDVLNLGG
jgi:hypothetical protein